MYYENSARLTALIARSMRYISSHETLLALAHQNALLQTVAVIDRAFALEKVSDRLDASMIVSLGPCSVGHRQDIHADVRRADRFSRGARTVDEALFADVRLAWPDHPNTLGRWSRHGAALHYIRLSHSNYGTTLTVSNPKTAVNQRLTTEFINTK